MFENDTVSGCVRHRCNFAGKSLLCLSLEPLDHHNSTALRAKRPPFIIMPKSTNTTAMRCNGELACLLLTVTFCGVCVCVWLCCNLRRGCLLCIMIFVSAVACAQLTRHVVLSCRVQLQPFLWMTPPSRADCTWSQATSLAAGASALPSNTTRMFATRAHSRPSSATTPQLRSRWKR